MTQLNQSQLNDLIDRTVFTNTTGQVNAANVNGLLKDMVASFSLAAAGAVPSIRQFRILNVGPAVDADFNLTGTQTFEFMIENASAVVGNLTIQQAGANLSTTIPPANTTASLTVNTILLAAGNSVVFTLSGTDGVTPFSDTYTVRARTADEYVYIGTDADGDLTGFDPTTGTRFAQEGVSQLINAPTWSGNEHLVISYNATLGALAEITIAGINQIDAFTRNVNAVLVNGIAFDVYVSDNPIVGSIASQEPITISR